MSREFNGSLIMEEFAKIAKENGLIITDFKNKDKDFLGNPSIPTPVKDHRRYEPTKEYDVTKYEDVIQLAHPKKVQVADSMGEGGVVENLNEQHEKDVQIAVKMPNGALIGVHADIINNLVKLANKFEDEGKYLEARCIDDTIEKLTYSSFKKDYLYKKAWIWPAVQVVTTLAGMFGPSLIDWMTTKKDPITGKIKVKPGKKTFRRVGKAGSLAATGVGILSLLGNKITGRQENLKEDTKDLIEILEKSESKSAKKILNILYKYSQELMNPSLSKKYYHTLLKLNELLPQIESNIIFYTKVEDPSVTGYSLSGRAENKFNDFKNSFNDALKNFSDAREVAGKASKYAEDDLNEEKEVASEIGEEKEDGKESSDVKFIQNILFNRGFKNKVWDGNVSGILDNNTIKAVKELEMELDKTLAPFAKKEGLKGTMIGELINNNKILIKDYGKFKTILEMAEKL